MKNVETDYRHGSYDVKNVETDYRHGSYDVKNVDEDLWRWFMTK